jgi:hypothetical protein
MTAMTRCLLCANVNGSDGLCKRPHCPCSSVVWQLLLDCPLETHKRVQDAQGLSPGQEL